MQPQRWLTYIKRGLTHKHHYWSALSSQSLVHRVYAVIWGPCWGSETKGKKADKYLNDMFCRFLWWTRLGQQNQSECLQSPLFLEFLQSRCHCWSAERFLREQSRRTQNNHARSQVYGILFPGGHFCNSAKQTQQQVSFLHLLGRRCWLPDNPNWK